MSIDAQKKQMFHLRKLIEALTSYIFQIKLELDEYVFKSNVAESDNLTEHDKIFLSYLWSRDNKEVLEFGIDSEVGVNVVIGSKIIQINLINVCDFVDGFVSENS